VTAASPIKSVFVETLKLTRFRNHERLSLDAGSAHVVLHGANGSGKTNILEAISMLSPGRGLRRAPYDRLAQVSGGGDWTVFAKLEGVLGEVGVGTGIGLSHLGPETSRRVQIDGSPARTVDTLLDHLRVLWLVPSMDGLFTGPAGDRRRFLDRLVMAIDPAHGRRVADQEKTLRSRNRLLADYNTDPTWLDAVEVQLAALGVAIADARRILIGHLMRVMEREEKQRASPFPYAVIALEGTLESEMETMSAAQVEDGYLERLKASRKVDAAASRTLEGTHRSDLIVEHGPKAMPAHLCSTGEQKALLVGLVLAQASLTAELHGATPLLLLDEIAAHLDQARRHALFDLLDALGCQSWMTGTDRGLFDGLEGRAQIFEVCGSSSLVKEA